MPKIRVEIEVPKGPYCHHGTRANDGDGHWRDAHHYKLMAEDAQKELAALKEKYGDVTEGAK